jgi:hypothetical protein
MVVNEDEINDVEKYKKSLMAISMAMAMRRCGEVHITQWSRCMATLDATERRHWASIHHTLPW